jgi:hypothetical protein
MILHLLFIAAAKSNVLYRMLLGLSLLSLNCRHLLKTKPNKTFRLSHYHEQSLDKNLRPVHVSPFAITYIHNIHFNIISRSFGFQTQQFLSLVFYEGFLPDTSAEYFQIIFFVHSIGSCCNKCCWNIYRGV